MMWANHILMSFTALACGVAVSAGTFAFLLVIGVVPRMIKKMNLAGYIITLENAIVLGILTGAAFSIIEWNARFPIAWMGHLLLAVYGAVAGVFVGCIAVALAEILNTYPIVFRRLYINRGLSYVMIAMALGKMIGSFYYFVYGYGLPEYW